MSLETAYDLDSKIHEGVRSVIYRGRRSADGEAVVVKSFRSAYPAPGEIAKLKHEFEILYGLDVPGVVRAHALETDGNSWSMILEDFGGESLDAVIGDDSLGPDDRLRLAIAIIEAIGQVHASDVIHKNINPSNIVWNRTTNRLKLIDFGIATRLLREEPIQRSAHVLEGTLAYMSPEQTGRMNSAVDYRADFYSFGVTLYELLTGRRPFPNSEPMALVHSHIAQRPTPPHAVSSLVPRSVSDVVMKLLEKTLEARYQSDYGIQRDLERCLEVLDVAGDRGAFPLAEHDVSKRFLIPQRLYGREADVIALVKAFSRVCPDLGDEPRSKGSAEIVVVLGPAGIGKSALVRTLQGPVNAHNGYFTSGKFEQFRRTVPYSAFVQAFQSLIEELLAQPEEALERWRRLLGDALGSSGRVLTDVLPQLELIVGPQPEVQTLGPVEAGNRFDRLLRRFIQVFAQPAHPLVLFLDDLQWADWGSLRLINVLMTDRRHDSLLLVGAYRDSEVGATHLLTSTLSELRGEGVPVGEIRPATLAREHIAKLVADTLASGVDEVAPLAESIARSTDGNPLFVTELLTAIHDDGLIKFDQPRGCWRWDVAEIEARGFTENVLELMAQKLERLPKLTQRSLCLAACIGSRFDPRLLSVVGRLSARETVESLLPAVESGVILTTSAHGMVLSDDATLSSSCSFFHDRLQQAAYDMLDEQGRTATHLEIGRLLLGNLAEDARSEQLFVLVDQFNRGHSLIIDPDETLQLATLNLEAGRTAKASTAYTAAVEYLRQALELLPPEGWKRHYELTLVVPVKQTVTYRASFGHVELFQEYRKPLRSK